MRRHAVQSPQLVDAETQDVPQTNVDAFDVKGFVEGAAGAQDAGRELVSEVPVAR